MAVKKRPSKTTLNNALDRLASIQARTKANHTCEFCGRPANQVHHAVTRANRRVRWNPRNLVVTCGGCHLWAEGYPLAFAEWFRRHRAQDFAYLADPENTKPITRSVVDLQDLREQLKREAA